MRAGGRRWGVALTKQQWIINTLKDFTFPLAHQDPSEAVQRGSWFIFFRSNHCISKPSSPLSLLELLPYAAPSSSDHHLPHIFHDNGSMGKCRSDSSSSCESYPPSFPLPPSFSRLPLLFNLITVPLLPTISAYFLDFCQVPNDFGCMRKVEGHQKLIYQLKTDVKRNCPKRLLKCLNRYFEVQRSHKNMGHLPQRSTFKHLRTFVWWSSSVDHHAPVASMCVLWGWLATLLMGVCDTLQMADSAILYQLSSNILASLQRWNSVILFRDGCPRYSSDGHRPGFPPQQCCPHVTIMPRRNLLIQLIIIIIRRFTTTPSTFSIF